MEAIRNLYGDREITGEAFVVPYKRADRFVRTSLEGPNLLIQTACLVCRAAVCLILGPLALIGMLVKYLNANQVTAYNEKIRQKITNRELLTDYPDTPDTVYRLPIHDVLSALDSGNRDWNRQACNIVGYNNEEVMIQLMARNPRWAEGHQRPFEV